MSRGIGMERIILHSDLNAYFASVECLDRPNLKGVPVAVCGSSEERRGIVLAKNEIAKRFGVKTGESTFSALQKCPALVTLSPHFDKYLAFSRAVQEIYYGYTDQIEPFGIDECWLDVSGSIGIFGSGKSIAESIRERVKKETGLTVSVGVSYTKTFSKIGSDLKKPDAVTELSKESCKEKIWPLPVGTMLGAGRSSCEKLTKRGVRTIGELASLPIEYPRIWLGKNGVDLWLAANGIERSTVAKYDSERDVKSISNGTTLPHDLTTYEEAEAVLAGLACEVGFRLRAFSLQCSGVTLSVRFSDFSSRSFQEKIPLPISSDREIFEKARNILRKNIHGVFSIRALTVGVIYLSPKGSPCQLDFFEHYESDPKFSKISSTTDALRCRYGKAVLIPASNLGKKVISDGAHAACFNMHKAN